MTRRKACSDTKFSSPPSGPPAPEASALTTELPRFITVSLNLSGTPFTSKRVLHGVIIWRLDGYSSGTKTGYYYLNRGFNDGVSLVVVVVVCNFLQCLENFTLVNRCPYFKLLLFNLHPTDIQKCLFQFIQESSPFTM